MIGGTIVVGISGGTCSGKSTVAADVAVRLEEHGISSSYLSQDWYYRDLSRLPPALRDEQNFDTPAAIDMPLFEWHLQQLVRGRPIVSPGYDMVEHVWVPERRHDVQTAEVVLVDGLFLFMDVKLRAMMDVKVFLNCSEKTRRARRVARDCSHLGMPRQRVIDIWTNTVNPMHKEYVEPARPLADLVLENYVEPDVMRSADAIAQVVLASRSGRQQ